MGVQPPKQDTYGSGKGGGAAGHQAHYDEIGSRPIAAGEFTVQPRWRRNHLARVQHAIARQSLPPFDWRSQGGYFDYAPLYDWAVQRAPTGGKLIEVGSLSGLSLCHLGHAARETGRRLEVFGVDLGVGVSDPKPWYQDSSALVSVIMQAGLQDTISLIASESTVAAERFEELDFVFLDAAHDEQSVLADLQAWWPRIKKGGVLAGHDYNNPQFPGVKRAVEAFFGENLQSFLSPSCWQKIK